MFMPARAMRYMAIHVMGIKKRVVTVSTARTRGARRKMDKKKSVTTIGLSKPPNSAREDILSPVFQSVRDQRAHSNPVKVPTAGRKKLNKKIASPKYFGNGATTGSDKVSEPNLGIQGDSRIGSKQRCNIVTLHNKLR
jgi:hypothetical protein